MHWILFPARARTTTTFDQLFSPQFFAVNVRTDCINIATATNDKSTRRTADKGLAMRSASRSERRVKSRSLELANG